MGKGKPPTPAETRRLYRADLKRIWARSPWWGAVTIWFAPPIEAVFIEDIRRAGVSLSATAPVIANNLRWSWRRSRLNRDEPEGWRRAVVAALKRQAKIGEPPDSYIYEPSSRTPPSDPRIKLVTRRASAFEPARTRPVVDRATRTKQHRQKLAVPKTPPGFDWQEFLQRHWLDVFRPLWRAYRLDDQDVDGEVGRVLAIAYKDKLDEQNAGDGTVGPASRRWDQLLRDLRQGVRPGQAPNTPRQVPPIAPSRPASSPLDPVIQDLFDRVLRHT
jgi:hypothetical protein